jgi:tRNA-2-methylthio-N6-dimethylallyladenosine synthase
MEKQLDFNKMGERYLYIETFGCQMNEDDSDRIISILKELNYAKTDNLEKADIIILNTCSIREKAEQKVYSSLGRFKRLKKNKKELLIAVGGCVAKQEGEKLLKRVPYLDIVFGPHNIYRLPDLIEYRKRSKKGICETSFLEDDKVQELFYRKKRCSSVKAYVTIMQGCSNYCSYCVVPYTRGRMVSRRSKDILNEIRSLAKDGVNEVTLLGQNVNSYGKDLDNEMDFVNLIKEINEIEGISRIRFTTSHPKDLNEELISLFDGSIKKLCRHIHLPVQSGSNNILKRMNRGYTRDEYLKKINLLREVSPEIAITTDIIVGFPGESERDFEDTMNLLKEVNYDGIFSFCYSKRPNTVASLYNDQLSPEIKYNRLYRLQELQKKITLKKNSEFKGRVVEVLAEGISKRDPNMLTGRSEDNRVVNFKGDINSIGKIHRVKINDFSMNSLRGEVIIN